MTTHDLPIAIIGGGPVGLAAAAQLVARGLEPIVLERGSSVGANVAEWGHVRIFTPWQYAVDQTAVALLEAHGWEHPDREAYPTGRELIERYLAPLAQTPELAPRIHLDRDVIAVTREGFDKMRSSGRDNAPFLLTIRHSDGREEQLQARAVIDASGTWRQPNPLGVSGRPAIGEEALRDRITYGIPDVRTRQRARYAGKHILVVGSGHSAFNVLLDLAALADDEPTTRITWAIRRPADRLGHLFGGGDADALAERGALGSRVQQMVARGQLTLEAGFGTTELQETDDGIVVRAGERAIGPVDEIVATTGFRPDLAILAELRLGLDPAVESPTALAPLIDPNLHSCGSVPPHGAIELAHPEKDLYIVGMKSYGRAPTFLMLTGYEQVRSIAAALADDWDAARRVELVLPETGVCNSTLSLDGAACCAPEPQIISLSSLRMRETVHG